ncbi:MAG: GvpL/GvpF family gas vesicle protein, partial [Proteobacteria bacterium]|nr:GvpL/GvpF family gas vesicle protein [Pseudomonadota bacterium]
MNYLIYCIFHTPGHQKPEAPLGVDDQPVALVSNNGLTAAISGITQPNLLPDVSRILTYKRVVELFHQDRTVIPMRYGCTLNGKQQVVRLLEEHGGQYGRLLGTIKGCVEMGIRVL